MYHVGLVPQHLSCHSQDKGQKRNGRSIDQLVEISCQKKPRNFTSTEETKWVILTQLYLVTSFTTEYPLGPSP